MIFVSDGEDTCNGGNLQKLINEHIHFDKNARSCTFLCCGVGSGFPTFLSMGLRNIYHTGDSNIPPVFLVQSDNDETQFATQFDLIKKYLGTK